MATIDDVRKSLQTTQKEFRFNPEMSIKYGTEWIDLIQQVVVEKLDLLMSALGIEIDYLFDGKVSNIQRISQKIVELHTKVDTINQNQAINYTDKLNALEAKLTSLTEQITAIDTKLTALKPAQGKDYTEQLKTLDTKLSAITCTDYTADFKAISTKLTEQSTELTGLMSTNQEALTSLLGTNQESLKEQLSKNQKSLKEQMSTNQEALNKAFAQVKDVLLKTEISDPKLMDEYTKKANEVYETFKADIKDLENIKYVATPNITAEEMQKILSQKHEAIESLNSEKQNHQEAYKALKELLNKAGEKIETTNLQEILEFVNLMVLSNHANIVKIDQKVPQSLEATVSYIKDISNWLEFKV